MTRSLHVLGNVQLDVIASPVTRLPDPGGDDVIDHIAVRPAGAAGNVSLALAALEVPHRLFGAVGDDQAGRWVADELRRCRTRPRPAGGCRSGDRHLDRSRGSRTGAGVPDRPRRADGLHAATTCPSRRTAADIFLLTGYFSLPGLRGAGTLEILRRARTRGALTVFDTGWDPDNWTGDAGREVMAILPSVDIFLPNEPEALALTGDAHPEKAAESLQTGLRRLGRREAGGEGADRPGAETGRTFSSLPRPSPRRTPQVQGTAWRPGCWPSSSSMTTCRMRWLPACASLRRWWDGTRWRGTPPVMNSCRMPRSPTCRSRGSSLAWSPTGDQFLPHAAVARMQAQEPSAPKLTGPLRHQCPNC